MKTTQPQITISFTPPEVGLLSRILKNFEEGIASLRDKNSM